MNSQKIKLKYNEEAKINHLIYSFDHYEPLNRKYKPIKWSLR